MKPSWRRDFILYRKLKFVSLWILFKILFYVDFINTNLLYQFVYLFNCTQHPIMLLALFCISSNNSSRHTFIQAIVIKISLKLILSYILLYMYIEYFFGFLTYYLIQSMLYFMNSLCNVCICICRYFIFIINLKLKYFFYWKKKVLSCLSPPIASI